MSAKNKLKDIVDIRSNMKMLIDDDIPVDDNKNYLINVGYIRVSTDKQAEQGYGLDIQERDVLAYGLSNHMPNLLLFIDDGYTGTNMNRPALQAIIKIIQDFNSDKTNVRINSMIIPRIDRLGRTLLGTLQFIQDYIVAKNDSKNSTINNNKEDINFISVQENYCRIERNNPQGKFLLMLFASLAEFDRDLIVEKLKRGKAARVASGKWMGGGNTPYGYIYDSKTGRLVVVPEEAAKIKEVFRLYIEEKMSPQKIANRLGFKGEKIVTQILRRKSLTGVILFKGKEYPGQHEAIIPLSRWQEAQDELEARSVAHSDSAYLLSGIIYCGECGAKMRYQKWDKNTGECKIICYSQQNSKPYLVKDKNCPNKKYWQSDIEEAVENGLFKLTYLGDEKNKKSSKFVDTLEILNQQLLKERKKLSRLYDFEEDDDADDILTEKILQKKNKIRELEQQIQSEEEQSYIKKKVDKAKTILNSIQGVWGKATPKERQTICRELIDRVVVYKDNRIDVKLKLQNYLQSEQAK